MNLMAKSLVALAMTFSINAFSAESGVTHMQPNHIVEVATFKLKPGVSDNQLLELEARIRKRAISKQAGYISRELAKDGGNDTWLMVMRFDTRNNMDAWLAELKTIPEMKEMAGLLDMNTMKMAFYQSLF